ncbi:P-loop containing nucleoside triphosphate hydrolase protein [Lasiosphaeria hispida]|uniref:P-loop containing nucleoside triphosphate hydrolase protein n=1 Tax=Lasiosphaeria hispida TaxID=260671 RepID=A0AAJ0H706_9PEZI|nr:P-loop containing nucleoside triphosphate hydrolase protein [Lasiosphaeria hispida]
MDSVGRWVRSKLGFSAATPDLPIDPAGTEVNELLQHVTTSPGEKVVWVALMGVTGAGKSTFIKHCVDDPVTVGHTLRSCTEKVQAYMFNHKDTKVVLVDTPGFDDTQRSDVEVLRELATWLKMTYENNIKLDGIIYMHRITDVRMQGSAAKNLLMFKKLCGDSALSRVILATTRWEEMALNPMTADDREKELKDTESFWGFMVKKGSKMQRHYNNRDSALKLINHYLPGEGNAGSLGIQDEMVRDKKGLSQTEAGQELERDLNEQRDRLGVDIVYTKQMLKESLEVRDEESTQQLEKHRKKLDEQIQKIEAEKKALERGLEKFEELPYWKRLFRIWNNEMGMLRGRRERVIEELESLESDKKNVNARIEEKKPWKHGVAKAGVKAA